ncbi:MAG: hypothetical protein CVV21_05480 [Candidatus Goldiibacteriota bacterium HGW-Goldbacteria-1]|jgi:type II restriction enzyme|nr:MAG: hypothetical protein CVV21_05480 [Candidatus Goldiibacteriota bacterium HGW-Goldbacteria-1]
MAKKKSYEEMTGNKGEWSEIYVLYKLLADGELYGADVKLQKLATEVMKVLAAHRIDPKSDVDYIISKKQVEIKGQKKTVFIPVSEFVKFSSELLKVIKTEKPPIKIKDETLKDFLAKSMVTSVKNRKDKKGKNKSDLDLSIEDSVTSSRHRLGFSIKSKVGASATLFNAAEASGLRFRIEGRLSKEDVDSINAISGTKTKVEELNKKGCTLKFDLYKDENFMKNLKMVDGDLVYILPELIKIFYYKKGKAKIKTLVEDMETDDFLKINDPRRPFYKNKVMNLLTASALGMTATEPWDGSYDASGGFIVVKDDGEILCYHFFKWNEFKDYLFNDTHFDIPSTSENKSYDFGNIVKDDSGFYIDLNFQIRFNG